MNSTIHNKFINLKTFFDDVILNYDTKGEDYGNQNRNSLKLYAFNDYKVNVKSFKVPNLVNQFAYRFLRKSKAQRSYEYANILIKHNIGTPQPIAFYEFKEYILFKKSYYISEHLNYDITYRELTTDFNYPNYKEILRAFTRFTFELHENNINFLDHSPGNTLITKVNGGYNFALVDLNRMEFTKMSLKQRIKNFAKLTTHKFMIEIMSDEYSKCVNEDYNFILELMIKETDKFQQKFHNKKRLKKKIKFWKS